MTDAEYAIALREFYRETEPYRHWGNGWVCNIVFLLGTSVLLFLFALLIPIYLLLLIPIHIKMKTLLLMFLLCAFSLHAAPLPPFPRAERPALIPTVPRIKATKSILPSGQASYLLTIAHTLDVDFFWCSGMPGCELYDNTYIELAHADGVNTILQAASVFTPDQWVQVAFLPPSMDRISFYEPKSQRHPEWFFRLMDVPLNATAMRSSRPITHLYGLTVWSSGKKVSPVIRRPKTVQAH